MIQRNNGHLTLQIWTIPVDIMSGGDVRSFLKASPEAQYSFWIKNRTGENTEKIFIRTKLSSDAERGWEYVNSSGRRFEH